MLETKPASVALNLSTIINASLKIKKESRAETRALNKKIDNQFN